MENKFIEALNLVQWGVNFNTSVVKFNIVGTKKLNKNGRNNKIKLQIVLHAFKSTANRC
jgi:hypothetical protein